MCVRACSSSCWLSLYEFTPVKCLCARVCVKLSLKLADKMNVSQFICCGVLYLVSL